MTKIKSLPKYLLPREKIVHKSPKSLVDYELLAILLGSGIKGKNVLTISKAILKQISKIGVNKICLDDISSIKGVGNVKAIQIMALIELSQRLNQPKMEILSDKDIWNLSADFRSSKKEHLVAYYLDPHSHLIERQIVSIGILDQSLVHPREIFEPALRLHASSLILVHNHPSESTDPSISDLEITQKVAKSGDILGIPLIKHIIVTKDGFRAVNKS